MTGSDSENKATGADWPVEVIRSARRSKTVSAELREGRLIVRAPATMTDEELKPIIADFQRRLSHRKAAREAAASDQSLEQLAQRVNREYFAGKLRWSSVRYVTNQNRRFGSCTPSRGTIRISHRVAQMPDWVLTYVVVHELAHLLEANHGARFWHLVNRYPLTERARGYLTAIGLEDDVEQ